MGLDLETSVAMGDRFDHHVGLNRLFVGHAMIARYNPEALKEDVRSGVLDAGGVVADAVDVLKLWFLDDEGSAVRNLKDKPECIKAFVAAVRDVDLAARNVGDLVHRNFADRVIKRQVKNGLVIQ